MVKKLYKHFFGDSLYRNSIFLMLSSGVTAMLGFIYWMIVTRFYSAVDIGLATTMISYIGLVTSFGILGVDFWLVRYLPSSEDQNGKINSCLSVTFLSTVLVALLLIQGLSYLSPKLLFIQHSGVLTLAFIIFSLVASFNSLIDNVFVAFRNTKYILIKNIIFSVSKLLTPIIFISFGAFGILSSWILSLAVAVGYCFSVLVKKFAYSPTFQIRVKDVKQMSGYSLGNYLAGIFIGLPLLVLPIIITNFLSPEKTAYYYLTMMIANLLFVIPQAVTQSLFAEGSFQERNLREQIIKSVKIISLVLIPAILFLVFLGKYLLLVFGNKYSDEGVFLLQILAISGVFIAVNNIFTSYLKVVQKVKKMIIINSLGSILTIILSYLFISFGLTGIGISWIIGQMAISFAYLISEDMRKVIRGVSFKNPFSKKLQQIWSIGIYSGNSPTNLSAHDMVTNPVISATNVTDVDAEFVADPFMIMEDNKWFMFFEVMNVKSKKGEIGLATSDNGVEWKYKSIILSETFHLSYPYIFKHKNKFYLIPESIGSKSVRLYKAVSFPDKWELEKVLLDGGDFVDPSVFHHDNMWWMFCSSKRNDELYLYYADGLTGNWKEHKKSPLIVGNPHTSRPAGRVVQYGGRLLRYTQDCSPVYGNSVRAFEITKLSTSDYSEVIAKPEPVLSAGSEEWNSGGMHNIDPIQKSDKKWIACVDGNREVK